MVNQGDNPSPSEMQAADDAAWNSGDYHRMASAIGINAGKVLREYRLYRRRKFTYLYSLRVALQSLGYYMLSKDKGVYRPLMVAIKRHEERLAHKSGLFEQVTEHAKNNGPSQYETFLAHWEKENL